MPVIESPEDFGAALAARRRALGLTQAELAAALGVSRQLIGELEHGKPGIRLETALLACRELGLRAGIETG